MTAYFLSQSANDNHTPPPGEKGWVTDSPF